MINPSDASTWPDDLNTCLSDHHGIFTQWHNRVDDQSDYPDEKHDAAIIQARAFDSAIYALSGALHPHSMRGFHCTRLTQHEISEIKNNGLALPNLAMLHKRIRTLLEQSEISAAVAERLMAINQADEQYRKDRIWFCFYEPHLAGQGGIQDLLSLWGGEALYNSHDRDETIGPILRRLGTPAVIEAEVPISSIRSVDSLSLLIAARYGTRRRDQNVSPSAFESCSMSPISAQSVKAIVPFGDPEFLRLTACNEWTPPFVPK